MSKTEDSEDVLSLLDSLGTSAPPETASTAVVQDPTSNENEKELLGFLDDLAKQPSRTQTPRPAGTPQHSRDLARNAPAVTKKSPEKIVERPVSTAETAAAPSVKVEPVETPGGGGWLGGLWSMGSAAMKTAEQKVKELQQTEEAKAWEERVRGNVAVLGKFGISSSRGFIDGRQ